MPPARGRVLRFEFALGREADAPLLVAQEAVRATHRSNALDLARPSEPTGVDHDGRSHDRAGTAPSEVGSLTAGSDAGGALEDGEDEAASDPDGPNADDPRITSEMTSELSVLDDDELHPTATATSTAAVAAADSVRRNCIRPTVYRRRRSDLAATPG